MKQPVFLLVALTLLAAAGCKKPPTPSAPAMPPPMGALGPNDWPQWRGPNRDDVSKETALLKQWPEGGPQQLWVYRELGAGYSGPAIVGGRVFIAGTSKKSETVVSLEAATGKIIWSTTIGELFKNEMGSGPRATPTVDGDRVYVLGGHGDLVCLDANRGAAKWRQAISELGGKDPSWGYSESVLIDGDQAVCTPGGPEGSMAAFDKMTGKLLWQSKEMIQPAHYSSIMPMDVNGARQYVQITKERVFGIDAKTGQLLWQVPFAGLTVIPTPIVRAPYVYVTAGQGSGCTLLKIGPENKVTQVYVNKVMKNHHGGVVLLGDHLYGHCDPGGWMCQDFLTGAQVWAEKGSLGKGGLTCAEGKLYCLEEEKGQVVLAEASPQGWHEVSRFTLDPQSTQRALKGKLWTHPVVSNGHLYLRDQEILACYDVRGK